MKRAAHPAARLLIPEKSFIFPKKMNRKTKNAVSRETAF